MRSAMLLAALGAAALLCRSSAQIEITGFLKPVQEWSLCEALEKMKTLDGQIVSVIGNLLVTDHGLFLVNPACQAPMVLEGQVYPRAAYLTSPGSPFLRKPALFSFDHRKHAAALSGNPGDRIRRITVTGRLDAFPYAEGWLNGKLVKLGFGHLNGAPMQIVMKDVVAMPDPASGR